MYNWIIFMIVPNKSSIWKMTTLWTDHRIREGVLGLPILPHTIVPSAMGIKLGVFGSLPMVRGDERKRDVKWRVLRCTHKGLWDFIPKSSIACRLHQVRLSSAPILHVAFAWQRLPPGHSEGNRITSHACIKMAVESRFSVSNSVGEPKNQCKFT